MLKAIKNDLTEKHPYSWTARLTIVKMSILGAGIVAQR